MKEIEKLVNILGVIIESTLAIIILIPVMVIAFIVTYCYHKLKQML